MEACLLPATPGGRSRGVLGRAHAVTHALAHHGGALLHELGDALRNSQPLCWRLGRSAPRTGSKEMLHSQHLDLNKAVPSKRSRS